MQLGIAGGATLLAAVMLGGFAAALAAIAGIREQATLAAVARRAVYVVTALLAAAAGLLLAALLTHDFALAYVTQHTDLDTPAALAASAFYSGQEGSLLYWTLVAAVLGSIAVAAAARLDTRAAAFATALLAALLAFLIWILAFVADPFDLLAVPPPDGLGLNPLLRDGGMLVHPPFLLAGLSSFSVPFSLTAGGLLAGRLEAPLLQLIRRFALLSWGLLSVGLTLGMWWAYHVLGWGGYWGWDPVENAALMPWLIATAYIHSVQVQERRGRLRAWSTALVLAGFNLSLLGTFIVRSGVVPSVHAFAISAAGPWFFGLLAAALLVSVVLGVVRAGVLRSDGPIEEPMSREGAFVLNNLLLVGVCAVILWGSLLPLTAGLLTGSQAAAGPAFYDRAAGPLLLGLVVLLAVGPLVPWRGGGRTWTRALRPVGAAAGAGIAVSLFAGGRRPEALLAAGALAAAAATPVLEFWRGARYARRLAAFARLLRRNRRRYAAYLAHVGIVLVAIGIAASQLGHFERDLVLRPGQTAVVGGHRVTYESARTAQLDHGHVQTVASLMVDGSRMSPGRIAYPDFGGQSDALVAIRPSLLGDVYVVLGPIGPDRTAALLVAVNPLVDWIWAGAALVVLAVLLGNVRAPARAPLPQPARQPAPVAVHA